MSGVQLGYLKYVLGFESLAFKKGLSDADADLVKLQRKFAAKGREFQSLGTKLSVAITAPLTGLAVKGVHEAQRMVNAMAQVNSALKSTGGAAGVTAEQLKHAAEAFETKSLFESEDILKDVSARLLAFGSVHGATFQRAQQDILDYAQRTGHELSDATVLVGKALDNPAKAIGILRKAGVTLSESQQALIKQFVATGNQAAAQDVILTALETKYRGAAKAAADVDPYHKLHVAFKQMAETVGSALLPLIPPVTNAIAAMVGAFTSLSPVTQKWLIIIGGTAAVLGPILIVLGNLITVLGSVGPLVSGLVTAFGLLTSGLRIAIGVLPLVGRALLALLGNPLLLGAAVLITGVYLAWKHWDEIAPIVQRVYTAVKTWLLDKLQAVVGFIKSKVIQPVHDAFQWLGDKLVFHSIVPDTVNAIGEEFARLQEIMVDPTVSATDKVIAAFQSLANVGGQVFGRKAGGIFSAIASAVGAIAPLVGGGFNQASFAATESSNATALGLPANFFHRALGGPVVPGRTYMVGENGPEYMRFGSRGYVSPPKGGNDNRRPYFDLKGAVLTVDLLRQMNQIGEVATGRGALLGAAGAEQRGMRRARQQIP